MKRVEPNRNVYVGHRYVPLLVGEWDKSIQYEGLSIVTFQGASYTSKKMTPAGIDIKNEEYWVLTGNYDAQVEYYRLETERVSNDLAQAKIDLNQRIDDTVDYVNTNVENLTIYVNDEVRKNKDYVDGEVLTLTGYVNDEVSKNKEYVDDEVSSARQYVDDKFDPNVRTMTINVPDNYNTLQDAIDYASRQMNGIHVDIVIKSGFEPSKGIEIENIDLSHVTLKSENGDIVNVSDDFVGPFLQVYRSKGPLFDILVDMRDRGDYGLRVLVTSTQTIEPQKGIINCGGVSCYVRTSTLTAPFARLSGSNDRALWVTRASNVSIPSSDLSGAKGGLVTVYVSRSSICDLSDADISNSQSEFTAVQSLRSHVTLMGADVSNALNGGILASQNGFIMCSGADISNAGRYGVRVNNGGSVDLSGSTNVSGAGENNIEVLAGARLTGREIQATDAGNDGLYVEEGGTARVPDSYFSRATRHGIFALYGATVSAHHSRAHDVGGTAYYAVGASTIDARSVLANRPGSEAVFADSASTINTNGSTFIDAGANGIRCRDGSTITVRGTSVTGSMSNDLSVFYGGVISSNGATTTNGDGQPSLEDCNIESFNSVSSEGIIYR